MKQYDKNSLIGLLLMGLILIIFNTYFFPKVENTTEKIENSNSEVIINVSDNNLERIAEAIIDSLKEQQHNDLYGNFFKNNIIKEEISFLENEKIKVNFSNKGGRISSVVLKEFQTSDSLPLILFDADSSRFNLKFTIGNPVETENLFFTSKKSGNTISMILAANKENYLEYIYTISNNYTIDFDINIVGMNSLIPSEVNFMQMEWQMKTPQTEKSKSNQERVLSSLDP